MMYMYARIQIEALFAPKADQMVEQKQRTIDSGSSFFFIRLNQQYLVV